MGRRRSVGNAQPPDAGEAGVGRPSCPGGDVGFVQLGHTHRPTARSDRRVAALHALDRARPGRGRAPRSDGRRPGGRRSGIHRHGLPRSRRDPSRLIGPSFLGRQDVRRRSGLARLRPPGCAEARRVGRSGRCDHQGCVARHRPVAWSRRARRRRSHLSRGSGSGRGGCGHSLRTR